MNNAGMSSVTILLLVAVFCSMMLVMLRRSHLMQAITRDTQCAFIEQETLNIIALASVAWCRQAIKQGNEGSFKIACSWPQGPHKIIPVAIQATQQPPLSYRVAVQLESVSEKMLTISYILTKEDTLWRVHDWTIANERGESG